jgi:hypothetical protein
MGIEAPEYYELGHGDEILRTMERILSDLKQTLPVLLRRVTCEDLLAIERENNGAQSHAAAHGSLEDYEISEYQTN